jgi:hypothetical protein
MRLIRNATNQRVRIKAQQKGEEHRHRQKLRYHPSFPISPLALILSLFSELCGVWSDLTADITARDTHLSVNIRGLLNADCTAGSHVSDLEGQYSQEYTTLQYTS